MPVCVTGKTFAFERPVAVSPFARVILLIRPGLLPFGQRKSTCATKGEEDRRNSFQSKGAGGVVQCQGSKQGGQVKVCSEK